MQVSYVEVGRYELTGHLVHVLHHPRNVNASPCKQHQLYRIDFIRANAEVCNTVAQSYMRLGAQRSKRIWGYAQ